MYKSAWFCKLCNCRHWSGGSNNYLFSPRFCAGCGNKNVSPPIGISYSLMPEEIKVFEHRIYRLVTKRKPNAKWWHLNKYERVIEYA